MFDFKAQFITYLSIEHDNFSILNEKWNYKLFSALNFGMISIYPI